MKTVITFIISVFISLTVVAENDNYRSKTDSIFCELQKMQAEIDSMKYKQEKFDYQKNYFVQAIESQNGIYGHIATWSAGIISILVIFIGLFFNNKFKEETKNIRTEISNHSKEFNNIKIDNHLLRGNVNFLYAKNLSTMDNADKYDQLQYYFRAMKDYFECQEYKTLISIANDESTSLINSMTDEDFKGEEGKSKQELRDILFEILTKDRNECKDNELKDKIYQSIDILYSNSKLIHN